MPDDKHLCVVCAWRETCQKRFKGSNELKSGALQCPDYTRDEALKAEETEVPEAKKSGKKKGLWNWS